MSEVYETFKLYMLKMIWKTKKYNILDCYEHMKVVSKHDSNHCKMVLKPSIFIVQMLDNAI